MKRIVKEQDVSFSNVKLAETQRDPNCKRQQRRDIILSGDKETTQASQMNFIIRFAVRSSDDFQFRYADRTALTLRK